MRFSTIVHKMKCNLLKNLILLFLKCNNAVRSASIPSKSKFRYSAFQKLLLVSCDVFGNTPYVVININGEIMLKYTNKKK